MTHTLQWLGIWAVVVMAVSVLWWVVARTVDPDDDQRWHL